VDKLNHWLVNSDHSAEALKGLVKRNQSSEKQQKPDTKLTVNCLNMDLEDSSERHLKNQPRIHLETGAGNKGDMEDFFRTLHKKDKESNSDPNDMGS